MLGRSHGTRKINEQSGLRPQAVRAHAAVRATAFQLHDLKFVESASSIDRMCQHLGLALSRLGSGSKHSEKR